MQPETPKDSWNLDSVIEWAYLNRVRLGIGLGIVLLFGVGYALTNWRKKQNEIDANQALFALPSTGFSARRKAEPQADAYRKVGAEYASTKAGERAELLAAGLLFTEGKYAEAQSAFSKFLESGETPIFKAQAALGVAASLEAQGKASEAITKYQEAIARYPNENIVAPARLTLARLFESQNKNADALKLYDDLARSGNPYDPFAAEAAERRELLLQKFPELRPKPAAPVSNVPAPAPLVLTNAPGAVTNGAPAK